MELLCKLALLTSCSDHQELSHVLNIWSDYLHCDNLTCGVLTSCRCYQNKKSTWSDRPVRIMRWLGGDKLDCSSSSILNPLTRFFSIKGFCEWWKYDELMCQGDNTAEGLSRSPGLVDTHQLANDTAVRSRTWSFTEQKGWVFDTSTFHWSVHFIQTKAGRFQNLARRYLSQCENC